MKGIAILLIHPLTTVAKLLCSGGAKALIAENLLLKQQLMASAMRKTVCTSWLINWK